MIVAITLILGFQLAGEMLSRLLGLPLPGPVLGMVGLLLAFMIWPRLAGRVAGTIRPILGHMSLFFVPAAVGIITHEALLNRHGLAILAVLLVSTTLALAVAGLVFVAVARWSGKHDG